jgi:hypothetical protein
MRTGGDESVGRVARPFMTLFVALGLVAGVAALSSPASARADLANGFQCSDETPTLHFNTLLPDGTFGQPYSAQIEVSGGTPPYGTEGAQQTVQQTVQSALQALNGPSGGLVGCVQATLSTLLNHTLPGDSCGGLRG